MARIRSIKPEFFTSETIASLDPHARLTFIGLWTHADDTGRALDNPRLIKAAVWPLDDEIGVKAISAHLDAFEGTGLICRYQTDDKRYLHITHWDEHQRIKNPSEPRFPECTRTSHGGLPPEGSRATPDLPQGFPASRAGAEQGTGSREQGRDKTIVGLSADTPPPPALLQLVPPPAEAELQEDSPQGRDRRIRVQKLYGLWLAERSKNGNTHCSPPRRQAVHAAIKAGYSDDDIADAICGVALDPWQDRVQHDDLPVILHLGGRNKRNNLEFFRDLWRNGPTPSQPQMSKARQQLYDNAAVMDAWAAEEVTDDQGRVEGRSRQAQRELPPPADSA